MNCIEIKKQIPLYIKGMVKNDISIEIEKHLAGCTECMKDFDLEKTINSELDDFFKEAGNFTYNLKHQEKSKSVKKTNIITPFFKKLGLAAATLIVCFGLFTLINSRMSLNKGKTFVDAKYSEGVISIVAKNITFNDIKFVSTKVKSIDVKKLKKNIVWLTVRN